MKLFLPPLVRAGLGLAGITAAASAAPAPNPAPPRPEWNFSLLPRSLERRPEIEVWIVTEHTARGRKLAAPSVEAPQFYVAQSAGRNDRGDAVASAGASAATLGAVLRSALRTQGLMPADARHPATLALVFCWGSIEREIEWGDRLSLQVSVASAAPDGADTNRASVGGLDGWTRAERAPSNLDRVRVGTSGRPLESAGYDHTANSINPLGWTPYLRGEDRPAPMRKRDQIERTALLVGDSFARQFRDAVAHLPEDDVAAGPVMSRLLAAANGHPRGDFLVRTINQSLHFVVVTAYDAGRLAQGAPDPLWRTKIVTTADGVGLAETGPAMLAVAAPHFGRETNDAVAIRRRIDRRGNVVLGDAEVVGWETPSAPADARERGGRR